MSTESIATPARFTTTSTDKPKRYHPALVTLHWLIAILMFSAFLLRPEEERGRFERGEFPPQNGAQSGLAPNSDFQPENVTPQDTAVTPHMLFGAAVLVLMVARLLVRWRTKHPEWATTGNAFLDKVGTLTHLGLYLLTFSILIAGGAMAYQQGVIGAALGLGTATITRGGPGFFIGALHGLSWNLLFLLLLLHVGAALYHQFIRKDNLLSRMWYGN
jgi:cytochrome b561